MELAPWHRALQALPFRAVAVDPTDGGSSHPVHRVQDDAGRRYALRTGPEAAIPALRRERDHLAWAATLPGVPCPTIVAYSDDRAAPFLLTTWEPGRRVLEAFLDDPSNASLLAREAGRAQARMHQEGRGLEAAAHRSAGGWAAPQSHEERRLIARLPADGLPTLVHLDFHPLNLLAEAGRIRAVLDWVNAGVGDPRLDVARTIALLTLEGPRLENPTALWVQSLLQAWVTGYEETAGPLRDMQPFLVWAGTATIRDLKDKRDPAHVSWMRDAVAEWETGSAGWSFR